MDALKKKVVFPEMLTLLANLLRTGIYKVDGEALDAVTVRRDAIQVVVEGKSTLIGTVNGEFLTILSLGKESRETKRQLMVIDKLVKRRNDENLQAVSHAFKISIHEKMVALLNTTTPDKQRPSVRHLLFLEREIFIFFSLLSGKTAYLILISALTEYGDPKSGIYGNLRAATYLPVFLQHLKILVRGVGRVGSRNDVDLLRKISKYGLALSELNGTPENQRSVVRTMQWIENVIRSINAANWHSK